MDWEKESENNIHVCRWPWHEFKFKTLFMYVDGMNSNSKVRNIPGQQHLLLRVESGSALRNSTSVFWPNLRVRES